MAIKQTAHIIRGLRRDFSDSKQPKEYAIDAKNIRITNREDSSLLSITNEKGTQEVTLKDNNISGNYLGHTTINDILVLFTRGTNTDYIYKINLSNNTNITLFEGKLSDESIDHIEALGVYESEDIQKVYWVDGVSQPRMINIKDETKRTDVKEFDFIQELQLNEIIKVEKSYSSGSFNSGVIQYAFNYYNKNGQESNIVEVTPINYISYEDRGAAPNDYVSNSFKITINNYDKNFDYLRLYSIHRTSLDAIPSVKIVADINLKTAKNKVTVTYIDTGIIGETIDPVELLYKGGEYIIPKTLAQKDGTLFFGNIKLNNKNIYDSDFESTIENWRNLKEDKEKNPVLVWGNRVFIKDINLQGYYPFKSYLNNNSEAAGFKSRETYRLGIQFQHKTGKWSDPIWYKDSEVTSTPSSEQSNDLISYKKTIASLYISEELKTWAVNNGYLRVRPVVVYPQESEREVITQGILCPTVFNAKDRQDGTCFAQSSWFLRPNRGDIINDVRVETSPSTANNKYVTASGTEYNTPEWGSWAEFRHYKSLPSCSKRNSEIQTNVIGTIQNYELSVSPNNKLAAYTKVSSDVDKDKLLADSSVYFKDSYFIDQSILTFHSPEIELGKLKDLHNLKIKLIGAVTFDSNIGNIDITLNSSAVDSDINNIINYHKGVIEYENFPSNFAFSSRSLISGFNYVDLMNSFGMANAWAGYMVYPWHGNASLNSTLEEENNKKYSTIKRKKISNIKYSLETIYSEDDNCVLEGNISLFSNENNLILPLSKNIITNSNSQNIIYKGDIDTVVTPYYGDLLLLSDDVNLSTEYNENPYIYLEDGRPAIFTKEKYYTEENNYTEIDYKKLFNSDPSWDGNQSGQYHAFKNSVHIKYKSTPHAVIILDYIKDGNKSNQQILSSLHNDTSLVDFISYGNISVNTIKPIYPYDFEEFSGKDFLWLAELYREEVPNKFGGTDYKNNIWYPAGKSERIAGNLNNGVYLPASGNIRVEFTQGDTFFARFDSLKTYSDDLDAVNSVTEIGSFMVETRINLDARYDRNRGQQSNLVMNPGNFNLFNDVYNQKNNFFNYRIIDKDIADNTKFPNTIVWSKQKFAGADVDAWTNINMASSLDLDGTKGELTKLVSFKNEIFSFQPEAINHILFNSRVQIPTSDGVPIELTNAYKVDGARQLSSVGSSNPLAITSTDRGIYYMDNITKGIYVFNGQVSDPLSDKLGMSSWVKQQDIDSYRIDYDKINQDVYFINHASCLGYSEKLGEFESFFDYNNSKIFNIKDGTYAIKSNKLYKLFEGNYNRFFEYGGKPFWVTFTHNENPFNDKIYNTLEFRADTYEYNTKEDENGDIVTYCELSNNSSFNTIKVKNEYQDTEEVSLEFNRFTPSNLKRKFRIWRANIPRDFINKRDRIRNTWANITLKASNPSNTKTELHDLVVSYFM